MFYISCIPMLCLGVSLMDRISSGIPGLDKLIVGGIPSGYSMSLKGPPGSGKTTMALQFLIEGARKGETGLYVSFKEPLSRVQHISDGYGWNIEKQIDEKIFLETLSTDDVFERSIPSLLALIERYDAKRVVFDSLKKVVTGAKPFMKDEVEVDFDTFLRKLEQMGVTTIFVTNRENLQPEKIVFDALDFIFDGILILDIRIVGGEARNYVYVQKMRATAIDHGFRPLIFGKHGLEVRSKESVSARVKGFFGDEE